MQHLPQLRFAVAGDSLTRNPVREGTPSQGMGCFRTGVLPVNDSKPKEEQGSEEGVGGTSRMVDVPGWGQRAQKGLTPDCHQTVTLGAWRQYSKFTVLIENGFLSRSL